MLSRARVSWGWVGVGVGVGVGGLGWGLGWCFGLVFGLGSGLVGMAWAGLGRVLGLGYLFVGVLVPLAIVIASVHVGEMKIIGLDTLQSIQYMAW